MGRLVKVVIAQDANQEKLEEAASKIARRLEKGKEVWVEEDKLESLRDVLGESLLEDMSE